MTSNPFVASTIIFPRKIIRQIRESSTLSVGMRRKPQLISRWLIGAHGAQIAIILAFVLLQFAFPPARDAMVNRIYSSKSLSESIKGVFGGTSETDQRRTTAGRILTILATLGCGSVVFILLWIQIPKTIRRATVASQLCEREADTLIETQPSEGIVLYQSALELACDPEHEEKLREKIHQFDERRATVEIITGQHSPPRQQSNELVAHRYEIMDELGRGANGVVQRAHDVVLDRQVALKQLQGQRSDDDAMLRFGREARIVARLNHPNIVQVYDLVRHNGSAWIVMELVTGGDLDSRLERSGVIPANEMARLVQPIIAAFSFAHDQGIIHRDLKPANILMTADGKMKVTDFGLARFTEGSSHTVEGTILGSPHYMSPEQAEGNPSDHRSDIYSLGIMMYRMVTGKLPFEGEMMSLLMQHARRVPPRPRKVAPDLNIPLKLERLIMQMLAKQPDRRPKTMAVVAQRLEAIMESESNQIESHQA